MTLNRVCCLGGRCSACSSNQGHRRKPRQASERKYLPVFFLCFPLTLPPRTQQPIYSFHFVRCLNLIPVKHNSAINLCSTAVPTDTYTQPFKWYAAYVTIHKCKQITWYEYGIYVCRYIYSHTKCKQITWYGTYDINTTFCFLFSFLKSSYRKVHWSFHSFNYCRMPLTIFGVNATTFLRLVHSSVIFFLRSFYE